MADTVATGPVRTDAINEQLRICLRFIITPYACRLKQSSIWYISKTRIERLRHVSMSLRILLINLEYVGLSGVRCFSFASL